MIEIFMGCEHATWPITPEPLPATWHVWLIAYLPMSYTWSVTADMIRKSKEIDVPYSQLPCLVGEETARSHPPTFLYLNL